MCRNLTIALRRLGSQEYNIFLLTPFGSLAAFLDPPQAARYFHSLPVATIMAQGANDQTK